MITMSSGKQKEAQRFGFTEGGQWHASKKSKGQRKPMRRALLRYFFNPFLTIPLPYEFVHSHPFDNFAKARFFPEEAITARRAGAVRQSRSEVLKHCSIDWHDSLTRLW